MPSDAFVSGADAFLRDFYGRQSRAEALMYLRHLESFVRRHQMAFLDAQGYCDVVDCQHRFARAHGHFDDGSVVGHA